MRKIKRKIEQLKFALALGGALAGSSLSAHGLPEAAVEKAGAYLTKMLGEFESGRVYIGSITNETELRSGAEQHKDSKTAAAALQKFMKDKKR